MPNRLPFGPRDMSFIEAMQEAPKDIHKRVVACRTTIPEARSGPDRRIGLNRVERSEWMSKPQSPP